MANPNQSKYDYLYESNKPYMNLTALSFGDRKITYEEMHERINQYARALYKKGIRPGDVIGVCCLNTPESVYLLYALDMIGAITVGLSPFDNKRTKEDLELTRPKMVITVDTFYNYFKDHEQALGFSSILYSPLESVRDLKIKVPYRLMQLFKGNFILDRESHLMHLVKNPGEELVRGTYEPRQLTDIIFTGGSTGTHKGVDLPGDGLNYVSEGMKKIFPSEPGMIHLGNIPMGHMSYGRMLVHFALSNNLEYALTLKAMPEDFYDEMVRTRCHGAVGGPPHWTSLIEKAPSGELIVSSRLRKGTLTNLLFATSGGEAKKQSTEAAINAALDYCGADAKIGDGLGATETWASMFLSNSHMHSPGTIGEPISTLDFKLVDPETGERVEQGKKGVLYVSGPTIMLGYHNNPRENERVFETDETGKRWCNIGDILEELPSGEYKYVGRKKRNFVSEVDNVYPEELEDLLVTIPEIREAVVTPISDEMLQYVPRYHISLYTDQIDITALEKRITDLVMLKLGPSWLPGSFDYSVEPLKRMANSKVDITYYMEKDRQDMEEQRLTHEQAVGLRLRRK